MAFRVLRKRTQKEFDPASPFRPAQPGRPAQEARDAYCTTKKETTTELSEPEFVPAREGTTGQQPSVPDGAAVSPVFETRNRVVDGRFSTVEVLVGWIVQYPVNTTKEVEVCFPPQEAKPAQPPQPAQPATPAEWKKRKNFGWNAGARSIDRIDGDVRTEFLVGQDTGVAVGLSRFKRSDHFRDIDFCMRFTAGTLDIFEGGERLVNNVSYDKDADSFKITRQAGTVIYYKNNERIYTSTKKSTGSLVVVASLYAGGDEVI